MAYIQYSEGGFFFQQYLKHLKVIIVAYKLLNDCMNRFNGSFNGLPLRNVMLAFWIYLYCLKKFLIFFLNWEEPYLYKTMAYDRTELNVRKK